MQALPALLDRDIVGFGQAIGALQKLVGDYFAPAQGGRFTSPAVAEALEWLEQEGIAGIGQSSWGPTGFAVFASETQARNLLKAAQARWGELHHLSFMLVSGLNHGGEIQTRPIDNVQRMLQRN
jgi:predicted sugar kinase